MSSNRMCSCLPFLSCLFWPVDPVFGAPKNNIAQAWNEKKKANKRNKQQQCCLQALKTRGRGSAEALCLCLSILPVHCGRLHQVQHFLPTSKDIQVRLGSSYNPELPVDVRTFYVSSCLFPARIRSNPTDIEHCTQRAANARKKGLATVFSALRILLFMYLGPGLGDALGSRGLPRTDVQGSP